MRLKFICASDLRRSAAIAALAGWMLCGCAALPAAAQQTIMAPQDAPTQSVPQRNPVCVRLESQLGAFDRGQGSDRGAETRRIQDAVSRQQAEVDRLGTQARSLNCGGGFFLFGGHPPQCDHLNAQSARARTALDQMMEQLQRAEGAGSDRDEERQSIVVALAQNNCGGQYRAAATQPRGFLGSLFGGGQQETTTELPPPPSAAAPVDTSTYRTVCVRTCDGSYFPISFATTPAKFATDERTCQRVCPATQVALYAYHNAGEDISKAVSTSGQPYTALPTAFRFRQAYDPACTCKRAGESWAAAVKDDTIERGDVVVTDQTARTMSQPPTAPAPKPARRSDNTRAHPRTAKPQAAQTAPAISPAATSAAALPPPPSAPRPVGPRFYQQ